jgi:hypothetical protein
MNLVLLPRCKRGRRVSLHPPFHKPVPDGARPSSGAALLLAAIALGPSRTFLTNNAAAPEDGRAPYRNRFTDPTLGLNAAADSHDLKPNVCRICLTGHF